MNPSDIIYHIGSKHRWLDIDFKAIWQYRELYYMYIQRDIVTYYKQTIFGPLWYVVQPVLTTLLYMLIFGAVAKIPTDGIPQPLFYLSGIALWNYFNQCFTACSTVFSVNQHVFSKVYFPRLVVPFAMCTSTLIRLGIQIGIFVVVLLYYVLTGSFSPDVNVLISLPLALVLIILVGLHAMTWGMFFSSWTVRYRDLQYMIPFLLQLGMYVTPVIYPLSFMPTKYKWIIDLNPLTSLFEAFRYSCLGVGTFDTTGLMYSVGVLCVTMFGAILVFNRTERYFVDII